jgi:hypothetical protein
VFNLPPSEPGQSASERSHELTATRNLDDPVEKVLFNDPSDLRLAEQPSTNQDRRAEGRVRKIEADQRVTDDLSSCHQQGVFNKEPVFVRECSPQRGRQQLRPKLSLELDGGQGTVSFVQRRQIRDVQGVRRTLGPEPGSYLMRCWSNFLGGCQDSLQPQAQPVNVR